MAVDWSRAFSTGSSTAPGYNTVSPLSDQAFNDLYNQTRSMIPTGLDSLQTLIGQGMNSPLLQQILGPALARLMGTENVSRQAVTDAARATGGLRGTAYGQSYAQNEQNIMQNRGNLISDVIAKTLGTLVPGMLQEQKNSFMPSEEYMNLMKLIRPDIVTNRGMVGGGGAYGGGSFLDRPFTDLTGNTMPNPYPGNADPGLALTGVNYRPNPFPVAQPYYDPFSGGGGGGGASGGYGVTNNPNTGTWVSDPFGGAAGGGGGGNNSLINYGPWQDMGPQPGEYY